MTVKPKLRGVRAVEGSVATAKGFRVAGVPAAIKRPGREDVALIVADAPCAAAAVFTTNKVAAAPVVYDREAIAGGVAQAILANSGCANACTGADGLRDARTAALATAGELGIAPEHVLVASTGVIGRRLPLDRLLGGMKAAAAALGSDAAAERAAERAIMTTDTRPKHAAATVRIGGRRVTVGGMCKGSGMIEPNMATMLAFVTTDADISRPLLRRALLHALSRSFNRLVVDGDESTNDSLFILASGAAGNPRIDRAGADYELFAAALETVCVDLARQMARDGEGATKFVAVRVCGAANGREAELAARAVARSPLAKTSWFGRDPNWGRVLAAVGYSGASVDAGKAEVFYDRVWAYRAGRVADERQLARLAEVMKRDEFTVKVDLHLGSGEATIYTCDLSLDYVHINADYTT